MLLREGTNQVRVRFSGATSHTAERHRFDSQPPRSACGRGRKTAFQVIQIACADGETGRAVGWLIVLLQGMRAGVERQPGAATRRLWVRTGQDP